jgi:y4mF family transcriptional regulator
MKPKTVRDIAAIVKGHRKTLGWTQAELASKVGVGREWVIHFEQGKPTAEWGTVLRAFRVLGLALDLRPEAETPVPVSDDLDQILTSTTRQGEGQ